VYQQKIWLDILFMQRDGFGSKSCR
jgi:hypothetical protein